MAAVGAPVPGRAAAVGRMGIAQAEKQTEGLFLSPGLTPFPQVLDGIIQAAAVIVVHQLRAHLSGVEGIEIVPGGFPAKLLFKRLAFLPVPGIGPRVIAVAVFAEIPV